VAAEFASGRMVGVPLADARLARRFRAVWRDQKPSATAATLLSFVLRKPAAHT
jgi:hypothetical protein